MTGQYRGDDPASHWTSPATGPRPPNTPVVPPSPHGSVSAARDAHLAAGRGRHARRWLVLATVLVLIPLLMVLIGWVIVGA